MNSRHVKKEKFIIFEVNQIFVTGGRTKTGLCKLRKSMKIHLHYIFKDQFSLKSKNRQAWFM